PARGARCPYARERVVVRGGTGRGRHRRRTRAPIHAALAARRPQRTGYRCPARPIRVLRAEPRPSGESRVRRTARRAPVAGKTGPRVRAAPVVALRSVSLHGRRVRRNAAVPLLREPPERRALRVGAGRPPARNRRARPGRRAAAARSRRSARVRAFASRSRGCRPIVAHRTRAVPRPARIATRGARAPTRARVALDGRRPRWRVAHRRATPNGRVQAHAVRRLQLLGRRAPRTRSGVAAGTPLAAPLLHPQRALRRPERHAPPNETEGWRRERPRAPRERRPLSPRGSLTCAYGPATHTRSAPTGMAKASTSRSSRKTRAASSCVCS